MNITHEYNSCSKNIEYIMNAILKDIHNTNNYKDDLSLTEDVGYCFRLSNKLLGRGSYGNVFLATDEHNREVAVKCCKVDNNGIPNILEASIMASVIHPHLNRALRILAHDTMLYIIMELAKTDLSKYTNRNKENYKPTIDQLRVWCHSLVHAVDALHRDNIIHADIKASNILLYPDGQIRLTDYTLATKKWKGDEKFIHNVCTSTHRPLECLLKKEWDKSLDIWSLGCTFYEIAYGELLFPYQDISEPQHRKDKNAKIRLRERSVNAIIDWGTFGPNSKNTNLGYLPNKNPISYTPFRLCKDYQDSSMKLFNDLLCKMLVVDPQLRPTIGEIISHPFFSGLPYPIYLSVSRKANKIPLPEQARVTRYIETHTTKQVIQLLAMNIYCCCNDMSHMSEYAKAVGCTWIASKLVIGEPPVVSLNPNEILPIEREICHNLLFRLHY